MPKRELRVVHCQRRKQHKRADLTGEYSKRSRGQRIPRPDRNDAREHLSKRAANSLKPKNEESTDCL